MKKAKTSKKRRPSRQTTTAVPDAGRGPSQPVQPRAGTDAPDPDATAEFKAGKDL